MSSRQRPLSSSIRAHLVKSGRFAKLAAFIGVIVLSAVLCLAGMIVAFVASVALFGFTPSQLHQAASLSWLIVFFLLFVAFAATFVASGYGVLVFSLHRFSATHLLSLLGAEHSGSDFLSRILA